MPYANILIPLDGSPDAVFACETATHIVCPNSGRTAHLIHCVEPIPDLIGGKTRGSLQASQRNESDKVFIQARAILEPKGITCHTYVREGSPAEEIIAVAEETKSEVIVMGTRGQGRMECLFGNVAGEVLKYARVPVILATMPV